MCSTDSRIDRSQLDSNPLSSDDLAWKKQVASSFGSACENYEQHSDVQRRVAESLAKWVEETVESPIKLGLEIGCGTGYLSREILERFSDTAWTITDVAPGMLNHCQEHPSTQPWIKPNTKFELVDGESLQQNSLGGQQFDLIVSNMTFQWFVNLPNALNNLMKRVQPNGWLFFSIPGADNFRELITRYPCLEGRINDTAKVGELLSESLKSNTDIEARFAGVAVNSSFSDLAGFLKSLKLIGANVLRQQQGENVSDLRRAIRESRRERNLLADFRIDLFALHKKASS